MALRLPDGSDPITMNGDEAYLNPVVDFPFSGALTDLREDVSHRIDLVGDLDEWVGQVVLFQYAFITPQGVAFSDVFGRTIEGSLEAGGGAGFRNSMLETRLRTSRGPLSQASKELIEQLSRR